MTKKRSTVVPRSVAIAKRKRDARRKAAREHLECADALLEFMDTLRTPFTPGDRVWARYKSGRNWYSATVAKALKRNVYLIDWEDGDKKDRHKTAATLRRTPP